MASFHSWSFFSGMLSGMFIRYTDILPILGGFVLGLTVQKLPDMMILDNMPLFLQSGYFNLIETVNHKLGGGEKAKLQFKKK